MALPPSLCETKVLISFYVLVPGRGTDENLGVPLLLNCMKLGSVALGKRFSGSACVFGMELVLGRLVQPSYFLEKEEF